MPPSGSIRQQQTAAREATDVLFEISTLLNTHLDRRQLSLCISLIEHGVNPEALATVVRELRQKNEQAQQ